MALMPLLAVVVAGAPVGGASAQERPRPQTPKTVGARPDQPQAAPPRADDDRAVADRPAAASNTPLAGQPGGNGAFGRRDVTPELRAFGIEEVSVLDYIPFIVQTTGKVVMPLNTIALKNKKFTVWNDEPMTSDALLDMILTSFRHNGVAVIEKEDVIILDLIENANRHGDIPVYTAGDRIESWQNKGAIIVKVFRLEKANADDVGERLGENLPDFASLTVDTNSNQIVVLADVGTCQHIQRMIDELDRTHIKIKTLTYRLAHADASEIEQNILDLFEQTSSPQRSTGRTQRRTPQRPNQPPSPATGPGPTAELKVTVNVLQNSVTVSADPAVIGDISRLIATEWDLPRPSGTSKVYNLRYTDPIKLRDILQEVLGQGGGGAGGARRTAGRAGGAAQPSDVSQLVGNIYRIEAYPEQNSLVVLAKTEDSFEYLDTIVEGLDQPTDVGLPMFIELKHADCVSLADELNTLLQSAGGGSTIARGERGLSGVEIPGEGEGFSGAGREDDASDQMRFPWQSGRQPEDQSPETALIGKVRIVPITRQNAVAVLCPLPYRDPIRNLIETFDRPGRQVMISAVIVEVELNDDFALGIRVSSSDDLTFSNTDNLIGGAASGSGQETGWLDSLFDTSVLDVGFDVNVAIQALAQESNVRIIQQPRVFTADNQEAVFFDGQDIPFITDSQTTDTGSLNQSFEYRQVGVVLNARPRITVERDVDLEIILELSNIVPGVTLFGGAIIDRRQTSTQVIVRNGQTIVLSGILRDEENEIVRKVPLLGDIPLLGELFKSRETGKTTSELIAFITPVVVDNPSENDDNFNVDDRERLERIIQPLPKGRENRNEIRETVRDRFLGNEPLARPAPISNRSDRSGE
jgi:general secretion pathway protein D